MYENKMMPIKVLDKVEVFLCGRSRGTGTVVAAEWDINLAQYRYTVAMGHGLSLKVSRDNITSVDRTVVHDNYESDRAEAI